MEFLVLLKLILLTIIAIFCTACLHSKKNLLEEKSMVIIIPSYNNGEWCVRNLTSVFSQNYTNYRIIYIDDCSTDNTYNNIFACISLFNQWHRTKLVRNPKNFGALANTYGAVRTCHNYDIIVILDGDDWFAHRDVLGTIHHLYSTQHIWLSYGSFINWPTGNRGFCRKIPRQVIDENSFRKYQYTAAALRTFYAWLFKKIKYDDLIDTRQPHASTFYASAGDVAYMFPMQEMAGDRFCYVKDILYIRNVKTPLNDFKIHRNLQARITLDIHRKQPYERLNDANTLI